MFKRRQADWNMRFGHVSCKAQFATRKRLLENPKPGWAHFQFVWRSFECVSLMLWIRAGSQWNLGLARGYTRRTSAMTTLIPIPEPGFCEVRAVLSYGATHGASMGPAGAGWAPRRVWPPARWRPLLTAFGRPPTSGRLSTRVACAEVVPCSPVSGSEVLAERR